MCQYCAPEYCNTCGAEIGNGCPASTPEEIEAAKDRDARNN